MIKDMIDEQGGPPASEQSLQLGNQKLIDTKTVAMYWSKIKKQQLTVHTEAEPEPTYPFELRVLPIGGSQGEDLITLEDVEETHTVKMIKDMIDEQGGPPVSEQTLLLKKKTLKDTKTLADYKIGKKQQLSMWTKPA